MSKWVCYECGSTDVWELSWVRSNRISWMLTYDEDVYTDYEHPRSRCDDCGKDVQLIEKDDDND